ncbi:MAG: MFS transporter [Proteobacteria bacterium]|nr:MFS transporter [Pseudomonadota bacterium]
MSARPPAQGSPVWRLSVFYGLVFLGAGASLPYLPVWLRAEGFSGVEIGVILALPLLARAVTGPALAVWADGFRERRTPLALLAAVAVVAYAGLALFEGFAARAFFWFLGATAMAAVLPLTDVIGLRLAKRQGTSFGRPRAAGSAAFILANLVLGAALTGAPAWLVLAWLGLAGCATTLAAAAVLPREPVHEAGDAPAGAARLRGLGELLRRRRFLLVIVSAGLIQAAHGFHYGFATLLWRGQGISEAVTGALWAGGVLAEIAFLWTSDSWRRRLGPEPLLILSGAAAVLRWTVAGTGPPLAVLAPLHLLHALTFAGTFVASTRLVDTTSPPESASAAHTLSASLQSGLFIGLATLGSGALFDAAGARGYWVMSAMAGLGLIGALVLARTSRQGAG